jgi:hypothetical protein
MADLDLLEKDGQSDLYDVLEESVKHFTPKPRKKDIKEQRGCQINLNPEKIEPQT